MKRIIPFLDMFDEIPDNSKYLYSKKVEAPSEETDEQKAIRISAESNVNTPPIMYIHYYEVDSMDFEELVESGIIKKNYLDKIKDFMHKYKLMSK